LFFDVAYISQPLIQYRFHDSNLTHRYLALDLCHVYLCKRMLLEKYPERLGNSYYETLVEDSTSRMFERAKNHFWQQDYKTAKQYLLFLKAIRFVPEGSQLIDAEIEQLLRYVDQANALTVLGVSQKGIFQAGNGPIQTSQAGASSALIAAIKPYVPPFLKKPARLFRDKLNAQRKQ
jgi:hypothetical protein